MVEGNWEREPGFENRSFDWDNLRRLLETWKAQAGFFEEDWPLGQELELKHLWTVLRPREDVTELLLKHKSPFVNLDPEKVAQWKPYVGYELSNVWFKPSWKRYKDVKVVLDNFPTKLKDSDKRREAVVKGFRALFVKTLSPLVQSALRRAMAYALSQVEEFARTHELARNDHTLEAAKRRVRSSFFEYFVDAKNALEYLATKAFPVRMVTAVVNSQDHERFPGKVVVSFTDTNPELFFWFLDGRTRSTASLLLERVEATGESSKFWKDFLRVTLRNFKKVQFEEEQAGSVYGKTLVVENHECTFDLHSAVNSEELTLKDLKLCTHCRDPGHKNDSCRRKKNVLRAITTLCHQTVRKDKTGKTKFKHVWDQHSWKLAGKCVNCGGTDHLRGTCTNPPKCSRCGSKRHDCSFTLECPVIRRAFAELKRSALLQELLERETTLTDLRDYTDWNDELEEEQLGLCPWEEEQKHSHEDHAHNHSQNVAEKSSEKANSKRKPKRKQPLPSSEDNSSGHSDGEKKEDEVETSTAASGKNSSSNRSVRLRKKKKVEGRIHVVDPERGWSGQRRKYKPVRKKHDKADKGFTPYSVGAILQQQLDNEEPSVAPSGIRQRDGSIAIVQQHNEEDPDSEILERGAETASTGSEAEHRRR